jgi:DNA anti-recombination protein RmuC
MGGIVTVGGVAAASGIRAIEQRHAARKTYRTLAQQADKQAKALQAQAQEEQKSLLQTQAQERRERYEQYRAQQSTQNAAFAAAGLDASSASVGQLVQNQALQEQLAGLSEDEKFAQQLEQSRQKTAEQIRALQDNVQRARQNYKKAKDKWTLGSKLTSFFSKG